jgi:hypothetical protein
VRSIAAFEAAARCGSIAKAADELHVSSAAVSRMVHLFKEPTAAGCAYQAGPEPGGPEFEYYGQALQAAADGVGVAMAVEPCGGIPATDVWLIGKIVPFGRRARFAPSV